MDDQWEKIVLSNAAGISVINRVDSQKYHLLINRICQQLLKNPDTIRPFSETEEEKLLDSLSVTKDELSLLLNTSLVILHHIIYLIIKPSVLGPILSSKVKLNEEKAAAFVSSWNSNAKALVNKYKHKSIHCNQLDSISWLVNIETANNLKQELFEPKALLQLKMKEGSAESTLSLEFNEQQLYNFYNTLENVQQKLDTLNQT